MLNAATAAFAGLGLIWGSNFIFMKWASDTLSAGHITFLRVLFGFVPVLVYALLRGALSRTHLRYAHHFAVMSLLATSVYYFAFAKGTSLLPSGIAVALSGAIPIVSFVAAAALLRGEPVTAVSALGVAVGFGGRASHSAPVVGDRPYRRRRRGRHARRLGQRRAVIRVRASVLGRSRRSSHC